MFKAISAKIKDGDRVIWIVFTVLVLISLVAIFSSTSTMAIKAGVSRMSIFLKHLVLVLVGSGLVLSINAIPSVKFFRVISQCGFIFSLLLLMCLVTKIKIGSIISVDVRNEAARAINIMGFNLAVYEVVKVAMVMYLAWAVHQYGSGSFKLTARLGTKWPKAFGWLKSLRASRWIYIFGPILIISALTLVGSFGSAALVFVVMMVTIIAGGIKWKHIFAFLGISVLGAVMALMLHIVTNGEVFARIRTVATRSNIEMPYPNKLVRQSQHSAVAVKTASLEELEPGSKEFKAYIDVKRQPETAIIAIVQGGRKILGKGPGRSEQKYVCPIMFEDYMFSFIIEEYGLFGGLVILILYMSLFARGMIIVHNSTYRYAKSCVAGLVFLITAQAFFHILVNCNIGLVTGQTLPLISHGRCSFICFCIAFGVILSISVHVNNKIKKQQAEELKAAAMDDIQAGVTMVEEMEETIEGGNL